VATIVALLIIVVAVLMLGLGLSGLRQNRRK
jgi:hypothetical protein